jgi:hypothetical protein
LYSQAEALDTSAPHSSATASSDDVRIIIAGMDARPRLCVPQ